MSRLEGSHILLLDCYDGKTESLKSWQNRFVLLLSFQLGIRYTDRNTLLLESQAIVR